MNKTKILKIFIFSLGLFIVGGSIWVMRDAISQVINPPQSGINIVSSEKLADIKPKTQGVPRQISYMGRLREARTLMNHDYYALASNEIAEALKQRPDYIEPYLILAEIYLRSGDVWKLENLILELEKRFPGHPEIIVIRTRQWITARKFSDVLERS